MNRKIVGGIVLLIVFVGSIGCYLLTQRNTDTEPEVVLGEETKQLLKDKEKQQAAQDAVKPLSPGETKKPHVESENGTPIEVVPTEKTDSTLSPLPPSSVPENIPEHLKLPSEWIDGHYHALEEKSPEHYQQSEEESQRFLNILQEIIRDHNPQRPLTEIWPRFIEYEKMYRAYAEHELGFTPLVGFAYNRVDWQYEQTWAFPEIIGMMLIEPTPPPPGEEFKPVQTMRIEMGQLEPEWNRFVLDDGRVFFVKGQTKYEFVYQGITETGDKWKNITTFSRTSNKNAPTVTIDVYNTSDEELKQFGGWNYSTNPLTLQPIQYERYISKRKAR